jgi:hypothetical protein
VFRERLRPRLRPWLLRLLDALSPPDPAVMAVEDTPNPEARRFRLRPAVAVGDALDGMPGAASVFVGPDFATVTRVPGAAWDAIEAEVRRRLDRSR